MKERPPQDPIARALERLARLERPDDHARALEVMKRVEAMLDSLPELPPIPESLHEDDSGEVEENEKPERARDQPDDDDPGAM